MPKTVIITGSHCTGKTTLVNKLKKHLKNWNFLSETAREIIDELGIVPNEIENDQIQKSSFQLKIMSRQITEENYYYKKNKNLISDRGIFDSLGYCFNLPNNVYSYLAKQSLDHYKKKPYDLIIFLPPVLELEDDGTRIMDKEFQVKISNNILDIYKKNNIEYITLDTTILEERVEQTLKLINNHGKS